MSCRSRVALVLVGLILGLAAPALAQTAVATLAVGTIVPTNCSITTTPVAFGSYDPISANAATPLDGTGAVIVSCTRRARSRVDLGLGANPSGSTRRMKGPTDFLTYELYRNAARNRVWGSGGAGRNLGRAPSRAPRTFTVYGRVAAGQDVGAGSYNDTVVATINF
jgi:spore coat protein U domain-containing protein, fimbrial subunit CupE1/2/3/6